MDSIDQIEQFMSAIMGQESGGDYNIVNSSSGAYGAFQIMPENWQSWASDAGLSVTAPMTAENQYIVAKNKMTQLFNTYGNWKDVARAWYAGEGSISWSQGALDREQDGYPSVNQYANSVYGKLQNIIGGNGTSYTPPTTQPTTNSPFNSWNDFKNYVSNGVSNPASLVPDYKTPVNNAMQKVTDGVKNIGKIFVGLVLLVFGVYLLTKDNTVIMKTAKEGE